MLDPRWRKVLTDLWGNKTRTALVVLSMTVGIFAVGMVTGLQVIVTRDMAVTWASTNPADATLYTAYFDSETVAAVKRMPMVKDAEGESGARVRLRVGPNQWRSLDLHLPQDYRDQRIGLMHVERGAWPPASKEVVLERASLAETGADVGDLLYVELADGTPRELRVVGTVHNPSFASPLFSGGGLNGYVNRDTMEWLGGSQYMSRLHIIAAESLKTQSYVDSVTEQVSEKLERAGVTVGSVYVPPPGEHPAKFLMDAMAVLLGILGVLALFLSAFLIINTINALLLQQVRQIGMMKAIGADAGQLLAMYLALVVAFGLLALAIAMPLSVVTTHMLTTWVAAMINYEQSNLSIPAEMTVVEMAVALLAPALAALYPVVTGTRVTVRQALSNYGITANGSRRGRLSQLLESVRGVPRPLLLSLRNAFRRQGRLALTLITFTLAGAIFTSVVCMKESLDLTVDDLMAYFREDVRFWPYGGYRLEQLEHEVRAVPGVVHVEVSNVIGGTRVRTDETESNTIAVSGLTPGTKLTQPTMVQGRWLLPEDENAIVLGTDVLRTEPDVHVGDDIVLKIRGRKTTWRVVGICLILGTNSETTAYVNKDALLREVSIARLGTRVQVVTAAHDPASQATVARALDQHFKQAGFRLSTVETFAGLRSRIVQQVDVIVIFLAMMAIILALVGAIGLVGTMGINVLERTREIGVLRAIGAEDGDVRQIVVAEGVLIGLISWVLGTALALPISRVMSDGIGMAFLRGPLHYTFSPAGVLIWLGIIVALSALASMLPAHNACRVSVRQALAYE